MNLTQSTEKARSPDRAVTPYDFTKPTPLPVEWQHRLTTWWRVALGVANKAWAKQLSAPLEASVQSLELCFAKQALTRMTDDTLVYRIKLGDRLVSALIMPRVLMLELVGLMLGDSVATSDRELTLIEDKLADYFLLHNWLAFFRESWPGADGISWVLDGRELNLSCSRLFADMEVLVALNWQMRSDRGATGGTWLFPKKTLVDLWTNQTATGPAAVPDAHVAARREAIVQNLSLNLEIVLGTAELPLSELSSLQVGDVVLLDQRATDGVLARTGGQDLFRGQPGRIGSWRAFQIATAVKK